MTAPHSTTCAHTLPLHLPTHFTLTLTKSDFIHRHNSLYIALKRTFGDHAYLITDQSVSIDGLLYRISQPYTVQLHLMKLVQYQYMPEYMVIPLTLEFTIAGTII